MINLSVKLADSSRVPPVTSRSASAPAIGSQSFESELSAAVSQALTELGIDPSSVQVTVNGLPSQTDAASQNSGTGTAAEPSTTASSTPAKATALQSTTTTTTDPDDAYWAAQPAAVQQLRTITNETQRTAVARELASEGYTIDVPIMVWGWSPQTTTQLRQSYGYTWVPSGLQPSIPVAPGVNFPGLPSYDPNNPPPGSILV
ncbi:MAG TPA: hypothetical protein VMH80_04070 [Bryobacteraceae bacterium]|nr:hypothetical protein [Bryobacteraceae bacterium]